MDAFVFAVAAAVILIGAMGVVFSRNPVHSALLLVMTLFGIAVIFVQQEAHFLAAVQVVVYAGAIVVLFLFVIMLLGVDVAEDVHIEPLVGQRTAAWVLTAGSVGLLTALVIRAAQVSLGMPGGAHPLDGGGTNLTQLARVLFSDYLFAFEATSVLLVIAVVGAVVLANRPSVGGDTAAKDDLDPDNREQQDSATGVSR